ncbi:InlB B-repeat-containing protein [Thalassotalea hakodatensis]|uniref:InlB B-repeat-containing protein n=1 Tax=Thalassotalea hakodatensis TaxID=3030492 RepID=UPI00257264EE|nr:hypothetical protein [Thalassotalea hakodatensis]
MFFIRQQLSRILSIFITCTLAACGGGGDSDSKAIITPIDDYSINIQFVGDGEGKVDIVELNQSCSQDCTINAKAHSTVTLIATPNTDDFQFNGWQGCQQQECKLTLNSNKNVKAEFAPKEATQLLVLALGNGSVSIPQLAETCDIECEYDLAPDTVVTVIAQPDEGAEFSGWSEGCTTTELTCNVTVNGYTIVRADFETLSQNEVDVRLNVSGNGSVYIEQLDETCTNYCQYSVEKNTQLTFESTGNSGFDFLAWENCPASAATCTINISDVLTISAFFEEEPLPPATNTFTIKEPLGEERTNIPIQIARPFIKGEIANYPVIQITGQNIVSQATIKQRHDDGSVKHAIINFVLDQLPANGEFVASIENGTPPTGNALTKTEMLSNDFQFDAVQEYTFSGEQVTAISAREMLQNDHYTKWIDGPVATTLILADHSSERVYDLGADSHRSIRPIFHVTFWKELNQYTVRYVSENTNTISLQDQIYDLQLLIGKDKQKVYEKSDVPHQARSMWTKQFSTFDTATFNLNHNIRYLVQTNSVPYFDVSREISDATIQAYWNIWQTKNKDLYDSGLWQPVMAVGGGRPDIGLYPSWAVKWLFSGDWRLTEIALTQADLASAWPMHLREGKDGLKFDLNQSIDALGKIVSIAPGARPTHWTERPDWHEINDADKIVPVAELTRSNWRPDNAHHPDISSLQFLLTGDRFYLDQMLFSAAYVTGNNNAKGFNSRLGRGQTGSEGLLYSGEVRGQAWAIRTRVHTYDILPDDWPEKSYFNTLNENAFTAFQGLFDLPNAYPSKSAIYNHARNFIADSIFVNSEQPSPLGFWNEGVSSQAYVRDDYVDTQVVNQAIAPWMQNFVTISLGRAQELGYNTDNLVQYSSRYLSQILQNPALPNYMFSAYITPTLNQDNQWFNSVLAIANTYQDGYLELINNRLIMGRDTEHGYYSIGMAAAAYAYDREIPAPWQYMMLNVLHKTIYDNNPKWAILPRIED